MKENNNEKYEITLPAGDHNSKGGQPGRPFTTNLVTEVTATDHPWRNKTNQSPHLLTARRRLGVMPRF